MVDFRCNEYAADKVVADPKIRKKIIEIGIRRITHESNVNRKTVRFIATGGRVKATTLAKIVAFVTSDISVTDNYSDNRRAND
jgi:hypothetical protein